MIAFLINHFDEVFTYKASLPDWQQVRIKYADPICPLGGCINTFGTVAALAWQAPSNHAGSTATLIKSLRLRILASSEPPWNWQAGLLSNCTARDDAGSETALERNHAQKEELESDLIKDAPEVVDKYTARKASSEMR